MLPLSAATDPTLSTQAYTHWTEDGAAHCARWHSPSGAPAPGRIVTADDRMTADEAYGLACQGVALLWRGDFQNARQMLVALSHRAQRQSHRPKKPGAAPASPAEAFHLHRQATAQRARTLGALIVQLNESYNIPLRRAPDVRQACVEAFGPPHDDSCVMSLRTLLGAIGAHEWRTKGIEVAALQGRIHPHYGVFAPIRSEYLDLIATTPLPAQPPPLVAFDIGTGTGVLAAILARRGVAQVIATDIDPQALQCARENVARLGLSSQIQVVEADLFPPGHAGLVVCNPPWLPARPSSPLERGIYDPDSRMLKGFVKALPEHLAPGGEGWLILSDLAEHLGLRTRQELLDSFEAAGLTVLGRQDVRPTHTKATDPHDPLHQARAAEVTSLWRLGVADTPAA
jgi:SAM-dependent methyltransferase